MPITLTLGQKEIYDSILSHDPESAGRYIEYLKSVEGKGTAHTRPNRRRGKAIINLTTGDRYNSVYECAEAIGAHTETVRQALYKNITVKKQKLEYL